MGLGLAIIGVSLLIVAAVSRYLSGTPLTPAIVVVTIGVVVGPLLLDEITAQPTSSTVRTLAEATLAVVLFSDSSRVNLRALKRDVSMPLRLLGVGLPLTIVLGGLASLLLFHEFALNDAMILGVILAPTDAGLGSAVVTDSRLPQIVRQSLNVEGGLNDGICVPLLLILLASISGAAVHPFRVVSEEIGYGVLCGTGAALLAAGVVIFAGRRGLIDATWRQIVPLASTLAAYGAATACGGSGFIAAFVAGGLFGLLAGHEVAQTMRFTDETGLALDSVTFLVFGAVLLGPSLEHLKLADCALRPAEPDRRSHVAGCLIDARHSRPTSHHCVHGMVRSTRTRVDRVRSDRGRCSSSACREDSHHYLRYRWPVSPCPWGFGCTAGEPLRRVVPGGLRTRSRRHGNQACSRASTAALRQVESDQRVRIPGRDSDQERRCRMGPPEIDTSDRCHGCKSGGRHPKTSFEPKGPPMAGTRNANWKERSALPGY